MKTNELTNLFNLYQCYKKYPKISFDTRQQAVKGSIFFALAGKNQDGHLFADAALAQGAAYAVVDKPSYVKDERYLLVSSTLEALQKLANWHRKQLNIPVIAITGSYGKTTTKELLSAILANKYHCYATPGNFNNHIGVPISLLSIGNSTEIAIIEMGANHIGDIQLLCEIAQPTHGVITHIGPAHLEGFGSIAGVLKGKGELYDYLSEHQGIAFINADDDLLLKRRQTRENNYYYPQKGAYLSCTLVAADPYVSYKDEQGHVYTTLLMGKHHFYNIAAALCIGKYFGVPANLANYTVCQYQGGNNRLERIKKGSNTILLDAYNANPDAVQAALNTFQFFQAPRIVILADMNELGALSSKLHAEIVKHTISPCYQKVLLYGPEFGKVAYHNPQAVHFQDKLSLMQYLKQAKINHSSILIKGSRSYAMEELLTYF